MLGDAIGHTSLVMTSGEVWRAQRQRLTPMFHLKRLRAFLPLINEEADLLCKRLLEVGNAGRESLDSMPIFGRAALTIVKKKNQKSNIETLLVCRSVELLFPIAWISKKWAIVIQRLSSVWSRMQAFVCFCRKYFYSKF